MQRASNVNRTSSQPTTPNSEPPPKRRRTDDSPLSSGPPTPATESKIFVDRSDVRAALKAESVLEGISNQHAAANATYETQWVLDVHIPMSVQKSVLATEREEEGETSGEEDVWAESNGRQTYGSFRRKKRVSTGVSSKTNTPKYGPEHVDLDVEDEDEDDTEESSDGEVSDEGEDAADTLTKSQQRKRRAAAMDYTDERALAALDKVDLAKSSYAKSKGAFLPMRSFGHKGGQGRQGPHVGGKFKNKDKIKKNTKNRKR